MIKKSLSLTLIYIKFDPNFKKKYNLFQTTNGTKNNPLPWQQLYEISEK